MIDLPTGDLNDLPIFKLSPETFKEAIKHVESLGEMDESSKQLLVNHYNKLRDQQE
jgi:hypothetical protein